MMMPFHIAQTSDIRSPSHGALFFRRANTILRSKWTFVFCFTLFILACVIFILIMQANLPHSQMITKQKKSVRWKDVISSEQNAS